MKLLKFLRGHLLQTFAILLLLIVQSWCEISLPTYMSDIVNVGIQQSGIESAVAPSLRAQTAAGLMQFMDKDAASAFDAAYGKADEKGLRHFVGTEGQAAADSELAKDMEKAEAKLTNVMLAKDEGKAAPEADDSDIIAHQKALAFVKEELKAQGADLDAIQMEYLKKMAVLMGGYAAASLAAAIIAGLIASRTAAEISRETRHKLFERIINFSEAEVNKFSQASLITRATNDVQQIQNTIVLLLRMIFLAPIMGAVAFFHVLQTDTGLTWIIGASLLAVMGTVVVLMLLTMPRFKKMQDLIDAVNLKTRELIDGIMPIRAFGQQRLVLDKFDVASTDLMQTQLFTNRVMMLMMPIMMLLMNVTSVAIVWFGAHGIAAGALQVGDMMAFITYAMMIIMSFLILSMVAVVVPRASVAAERIDEVLSTEVTITDPAAPQLPESSHKGELAFENVSFSYPGADTPALEKISFTAGRGQTIGIVGATGSGKSSLVKLIMRFFDVSEGAIKLDGLDLRKFSLKELRSRIAYVPQQAFLFSGDIASNVSFGLDEIDEAKVAAALKIAQAEAFVSEKEEGIHAPISQGGTNVSGGQRQRLAIARALALDPELLILDDSFSALDFATDKALRHELARSCTDTTLIVVAARIASVMQADKILVLDEGKLIAQGTHEELLRSCPTYLEIAKSQLSEAELGLEESDN